MQSLRSSASLDLSALKEPRGFIRIVQLVLAIFAFATLTSVTNSCSKFRTSCSLVNQTLPTKDSSVSVCYGYPFRVDSQPLSLCNGTLLTNPYSGSTSSAEFFCFIGVMTFLACLVLVVLYVLFMDAYNSRTIMPKVDLVFSATWTLLWLIASAAWADGYSRLSTYLSADFLVAEAKTSGFCKGDSMTCDTLINGDNSTLIVSVLFGFLNFLLWGASLWFLFKDTEWHKARQQQQQGATAAAAAGSSQFDQPGGASAGQAAGPSSGPANLY